MAFFSVVIPTLNEDKFLPKLLGDFNRQLDRDFEAVVVDGKSEDKTVQTASSFCGKLPGFKVLQTSVRNVSVQRNLGARETSGKFLVFVDADARIPTNYLSQIHHHLIEEDPRCRFVTTWFKPDTNKQKDKILIAFINLLVEVANSLDQPGVSGSNIVVRRREFEKIDGFNEKAKISEDWDLAKRLGRKGIKLQILKSPKMTYCLRRLRREGMGETIGKFVKATSKFLLSDSTMEEIFDYPMGGKVRKKHHHNVDLEKFFKEQLEIMKKI
jgi:glycosyltransferase involved in cell wall biosynthesis